MKEQAARVSRRDAERATGAGTEQFADVARAAARAERQRLARDLHDSVTQTLISLHLSAQAAADLWDTQPDQARAALDLVRHLASGAATEMRALLMDLREAVLEQEGLVAALEALCAVVRQRSGLHVALHVAAAGSGARAGPAGRPERLPPAYEEALYRLVQEALANVVKHARATQATVTLRQDARVCVCVEDDGVGFGAPTPAFAYGLKGMRERVGALGGRLQLDDGPSGGARVVAELPPYSRVSTSTQPTTSHEVPAPRRWPDAPAGPDIDAHASSLTACSAAGARWANRLQVTKHGSVSREGVPNHFPDTPTKGVLQ